MPTFSKAFWPFSPPCTQSLLTKWPKCDKDWSLLEQIMVVQVGQIWHIQSKEDMHTELWLKKSYRKSPLYLRTDRTTVKCILKKQVVRMRTQPTTCLHDTATTLISFLINLIYMDKEI